MVLRIQSLRLVTASAFVLIGFAIGAVGCRRVTSHPPVNPTKLDAMAPGIVLLCIDTLRADAVALESGATSDMPSLDAFARGATAFADATSSSAWTAPSVATILTGLLPSNTGVRGDVTAGALPGSVTTLAEALRDRGYATAASTSGGWLVPERGYGQGFDTFSRDFDGRGPDVEVSEWNKTRKPGAPFFLFLHTVAAHDPYGPKDARWLSDPAPEVAIEAQRIARETTASGKLPAGAAPWFLAQYLFDCRTRVTLGLSVPPEPLSRMFDLSMDWLDGAGRGTHELHDLLDRAPAAYRAGLGHADAIFAQTLAALDALDLPADTIFVVVGDHGEALGEHGTLSHGRFLHDEMVRVPMLVRAPGRLPAGRVVQGSCGLVDLAPTLLELAEASVPGAFDGRSVVPLAMGEAQGHPVIAEEDRTVVGAAAPRALRVVSVRTDAAKWMLTYDVRTRQVLGTELFDLATDPGETKPLVGVEPAHFGAVFCNAVAQARSRIPGQSAASPCEVAAR